MADDKTTKELLNDALAKLQSIDESVKNLALEQEKLKKNSKVVRDALSLTFASIVGAVTAELFIPYWNTGSQNERWILAPIILGVIFLYSLLFLGLIELSELIQDNLKKKPKSSLKKQISQKSKKKEQKKRNQRVTAVKPPSKIEI